MDYDKINEFDSSVLSDEEVLQKIGSKLKELRLEQNIKQKELAEKSGLSMFSISQMETGHNTSIQSIVQVLRALDKMELLDAFIINKVEAENPLADRQRVSRNFNPASSPLPTSPLKEGEQLHRKVMKYSLPEEDDYSLAAEPEPEY